jgi:magnesium-transporting ATPase (P-type)
MLIVAALLSAGLGDVADIVIILVIVLISSLLGLVERHRHSFLNRANKKNLARYPQVCKPKHPKLILKKASAGLAICSWKLRLY